MSELNTVLRMDHTGKEVWRHAGGFAEGTSERVTTKAVSQRDDVDPGYVALRTGDYLCEHSYLHRWCNTFQLHDQDTHQIKGWYCSLACPAQWKDHAIGQEDLALAPWISADKEIPFSGRSFTPGHQAWDRADLFVSSSLSMP